MFSGTLDCYGGQWSLYGGLTFVQMYQCLYAAPRQGHLSAVMHLFAYRKAHSRSQIVLDPSVVDYVEQEKPYWCDLCIDAKELLPPNMPQPLGKPVQMEIFENSDPAGTRYRGVPELVY
jgi:hypothetical protein